VNARVWLHNVRTGSVEPVTVPAEPACPQEARTAALDALNVRDPDARAEWRLHDPAAYRVG